MEVGADLGALAYSDMSDAAAGGARRRRRMYVRVCDKGRVTPGGGGGS